MANPPVSESIGNPPRRGQVAGVAVTFPVLVALVGESRKADPERLRAYARSLGGGHARTDEVAERRDDVRPERADAGGEADSANGKRDRGEEQDG